MCMLNERAPIKSTSIYAYREAIRPLPPQPNPFMKINNKLYTQIVRAHSERAETKNGEKIPPFYLVQFCDVHEAHMLAPDRHWQPVLFFTSLNTLGLWHISVQPMYYGL